MKGTPSIILRIPKNETKDCNAVIGRAIAAMGWVCGESEIRMFFDNAPKDDVEKLLKYCSENMVVEIFEV